MVFNSITFLFLFLPLFLIVYFLCPSRLKNYTLLLFSLLFYFWGEQFLVLLLLASATADFCYAHLMTRGARKLGLALSIITNIGILFYFKYYNFSIQATDDFLALWGYGQNTFSIKEIALPIGISFYTFQTMSYSLDVYFKKITPTKNYVNFLGYVTLFPQLVAGPIVRYDSIQKQLHNRTHTVQKVAYGAERFIIGLFKKVVIADSFSIYADSIFNLQAYTSLDFVGAWVGIIAFSFQIYFDFSGYSDMAIGLCAIIGFKIDENFEYPYTAQSIREFWRKWHISLSTWFRDYLYIPLGGNRGSKLRTFVNLLIVFIITGLWHGANWNFITWGLIHGFFIVIERSGFSKILNSLWPPIRSLYTLLVVTFAWVFFRIIEFTEAVNYLKRMFTLQQLDIIRESIAKNIDLEFSVLIVLAIIMSLPIKLKIKSLIRDNYSQVTYYLFMIIIFLVSIVYVTTSTFNPFIYFRF